MSKPQTTQDVLMILPRKRIHRVHDLPETWELDKEPSGISLFIDRKPAGYASWMPADDFGTVRPVISFSSTDTNQLQLIFKVLVGRLAVAFDLIPSCNPLYIRLNKSQVDLIAEASRMGFIPYFGKWKESDEDHSVSSWEEITEDLRRTYPENPQTAMA